MITEHGGRVVHYAGDAVLADFASAIAAVEAAMAAQAAMRRRNAEAEEKLEFRIGINLGEVIVDRDDLYGDGVNVAARLEGLAEAGGICISETVRDALGNKLPLDFDYIGEKRVKNIDKPVRAYRIGETTAEAARRPPAFALRWLWGGGAVAAFIVIAAAAALLVVTQTPPAPTSETEPAAAATPAPAPAPAKEPAAETEAPVIAVLPFTNMSESQDQAFFADGITDDIIVELTKVGGLVVIARDSTFN